MDAFQSDPDMHGPHNLSPTRKSIYQELAKVKERRQLMGVEAPRLIIISDLGKDYDDSAAMTVLKELHRIGIVELLGYVANLTPADRRAQLARGALDTMGLQSVPVGVGTDGVPDIALHEVHDYEFQAGFISNDAIEKTGLDLLKQVCIEAEGLKKRITLVCLSSLKDANAFAKEEPALFKQTVDAVLMQGGATLCEHGQLRPDMTAANNKYDPGAAAEFLDFIEKGTNASTLTFTKIAAFNTPVSVELFDEMADSGKAVGRHLRHVQVRQDLKFYEDSCDPERRFAPKMDRKWFLENRTSWFEKMGPKAEPPSPNSPDIARYLTKIVLYDALPALAAAGNDVLQALGVLKPLETHETHRHVIIGKPGNPGVAKDGTRIADALGALMQGSQLDWGSQDD